MGKDTKAILVKRFDKGGPQAASFVPLPPKSAACGKVMVSGMKDLKFEDLNIDSRSGIPENRPEGNRKRRRKRRRRKSNMGMPVLLCIIALAALTGCLFLSVKNRSLENEVSEAMAYIDEVNSVTTYTEEETKKKAEEAAEKAAAEKEEEILNHMKSMMENGDGATAMLRAFYPNEIVVAANSRYYFFPILDTIKHHSYDIEQFVKNEDDELEYLKNEEAVSRKGIDVSKYQSEINWKKVAKDGVEYAFIRLGIRGSTEGKLILDDTYEDNMEGALENDIDVGVYFFTQALNKEEAVEEAEFVLENLKDYDITYPIVLDVEDVATNNARTDGMTMQDWTDVCIAFCETIKAAGYTPMIYGNLKTFMLMVDLEQLEEYEKWFAYYSEPLYFPYEFSIWQYTSTGSVNGIKGDVDLNISMKDWANE